MGNKASDVIVIANSQLVEKQLLHSVNFVPRLHLNGDYELNHIYTVKSNYLSLISAAVSLIELLLSSFFKLRHSPVVCSSGGAANHRLPGPISGDLSVPSGLVGQKQLKSELSVVCSDHGRNAALGLFPT